MNQFSNRRPRFFHFALCTLHFALLTTAGCEIPGVIAYTVLGEPPVPAQYVPKKVPTLVLVENYRSPDEMQLDSDQIAQQVGESLKKGAKLKLVDADKLVPLREEDPIKFRAMTSQSIGKAVGAEQIIYVDLVESAVVGDLTQSVVHAHALARVQVLDVATGQVLWPVNTAHGTELKADIDYDPSDSSHAMAMRTEMITSLSSRIAKLFYSWKPDSADDEKSGG